MIGAKRFTCRGGLSAGEDAGPDPAHARKEEREVYVPEDADFREIPVFNGHTLACGNRIAGRGTVPTEGSHGHGPDEAVPVWQSIKERLDRGLRI